MAGIHLPSKVFDEYDALLTFGIRELDNRIVFENVYFFYGRNGVHTYAF